MLSQGKSRAGTRLEPNANHYSLRSLITPTSSTNVCCPHIALGTARSALFGGCLLAHQHDLRAHSRQAILLPRWRGCGGRRVHAAAARRRPRVLQGPANTGKHVTPLPIKGVCSHSINASAPKLMLRHKGKAYALPHPTACYAAATWRVGRTRGALRRLAALVHLQRSFCTCRYTGNLHLLAPPPQKKTPFCLPVRVQGESTQERLAKVEGELLALQHSVAATSKAQ